MTLESRSWTIPGTQIGRTVSAAGTTTSVTVMTEGIGNLSRNSVLTLGYAEKKRTGQLPQNPFGFSEISQGYRRGFVESKSYHIDSGKLTSVQTLSGVLGVFSPNASPWSAAFKQAARTNLYNQAVAKAQSKIKDATIDLSVFAGELRETRAMFIDIATRLKLAIDAARRKDVKSIYRHLSLAGSADFANLWLAINYGIKPFIADLKGAVQALERGAMKERFNLVQDRARYQDSLKRASAYRGGTEEWTLKVEVGCRVKYAVTNPFLATLASLGLTNPGTTAWELAKLSFVVDWVVGVGGWLGQLDYHLGKQFRDGSYTTFTKEKVVFTAAYVTKTPVFNGGTVETSQSTAFIEWVDVSRSVLTNWPITYLPVLKDPFSVSHVATATALLQQTWGR